MSVSHQPSFSPAQLTRRECAWLTRQSRYRAAAIAVRTKSTPKAPTAQTKTQHAEQ
jgi:hypothetical protein